jgi:hypothetical protein
MLVHYFLVFEFKFVFEFIWLDCFSKIEKTFLFYLFPFYLLWLVFV